MLRMALGSDPQSLRDTTQETKAPRCGVKEIAMNPEDQWIVYRTRFLVRARQLTEPLIFTDAFGREQSGRPGDYLFESSDGMRRITSQALFEDIYVPLVPTQLPSPVPRVHTAVSRASPGYGTGNPASATA